MLPERDGFTLLGDSESGRGPSGLCDRWSPRTGEADCTTRFVVAAADRLRDGRIVVGERDHRRSGTPTAPGGFGIRSRSGAERVLSGDPGDTTIALAAEKGTNTAWAVTRTGDVTSLQRFAG